MVGRGAVASREVAAPAGGRGAVGGGAGGVTARGAGAPVDGGATPSGSRGAAGSRAGADGAVRDVTDGAPASSGPFAGWAPPRPSTPPGGACRDRSTASRR